MIEITNYETEDGRTKVLSPEKKQVQISGDVTEKSFETEKQTKEETKKWKKNL